MMPTQPMVDVVLTVHNGVETVGAAIASILRQSWHATALTLIDDASDDGTADLLADYAARDSRIRLRRHHVPLGPVANFQHALREGDAEFVLPTTAEDVIAPDFITRLMAVLLAEPDCAMSYASGAPPSGKLEPQWSRPVEHTLCATGRDPVARARRVMERFASASSLRGIYRRHATDRLSPLPYRSGWDRVLLAELALFGEIRHVPEPLYQHRDTLCAPVRAAEHATEQTRAGLAATDPLGDPRWGIPLIAAAYLHIETFSASRIDLEIRRALIAEVAPVFRHRWLSRMTEEAMRLRYCLPGLLERIASEDAAAAALAASKCLAAIDASEAIVPEVDLSDFRAMLGACRRKVAALAA